MRRAALLLSLSFVLGLGCGSQATSKKTTATPQALPPPAPGAVVLAQAEKAADAQPAGNAPPQTARKIKYTAEVGLIVEDFTATDEKLFDLVEKHKGYVARSEIAASAGSQRQGTWRLRIPVEQFNPFCRELKKLGEVEKDSRDSQDMTEEYFDLNSYIKTRQTELDSLRELMRKESNNRDQYLAYRREINVVEADINKGLGRLKLLANQTDYTSVNVTVREKQKYVPERAPEIAETPTFSTRAQKTFEDSFAGVQWLGERAALVAIALAPWLPLIIVLGVAGLFVTRRVRASRRPA